MPKMLEHFRSEILDIPNHYKKIDPNSVKLNLMESPFTIPDELQNIIKKKLCFSDINRYPDPECTSLTKKIISSFSIKDGEILLGNGLMELIQLICWAFSKPGEYVMIPSPSFFIFRRYIRQAHMQIIEAPLTENFNLDIKKCLEIIKNYNPRIIFIDYPNNPTGNLFNINDILLILSTSDGIVVVDEAYFPHSNSTLMSYLNKYENLIILRSFSKMGFAALRLGFIAANKEIIQYIKKAQYPFAINSYIQIIAEVVLEHMATINEKIHEIANLKKKMHFSLSKIREISQFPSFANFILFKTDRNSDHINEHLIKNNILINSLNGTNPLLKNCLRVAIGSEKDNEIFLEGLFDALDCTE
ncbi:MAG: histidinol-phosphate transaminase [Coxiellaceae bacterium]|nr:histidinol-phosphate transaminase [Coxiellaceae bacterium]